MNKLKIVDMIRIAGVLSSIGASLTLEQAGVIAGIVTGLVTCAINVFYTIRKDRREQRLAERQLNASRDES
jgi:hypothetical protein